jgi:hypothetical protein
LSSGISTVLAGRCHKKPRYLKCEANGLVLESFQGQPNWEATWKMSDKKYEKIGGERLSVVGYLKKTKLSTQFLDGPKPLVVRMADMASASLPKTLPDLAAPKGAL